MISKRVFVISGMGAFAAACTNNQIDPQKVLATLKQVCGIAVPVATVVAIISASVGATVTGIVDLLCSGFNQAVAAQTPAGAKTKAELAAGTTVEYDVVVNGKTIHVVATKQ